MPRNPWISSHLGFSHLRVPSHTQPETEADCVVYSLWMVANYVANEHPDDSIRDDMRAPTIDDIKEFISTDELGWRPNQSDLTDLSTFLCGLNFSLESWDGSPPRSLIDLAVEQLDENLPLIAFIDAQQLRQGTPRGSGPLHSVVIAGIDEHSNEVAIADPWFAAIHSVSGDNLEDAWDPSLHQIIDIAVNQSGEPASGTDQ